MIIGILNHKINIVSVEINYIINILQQMEDTFIMIKPDGVQRGLVGEIIGRF